MEIEAQLELLRQDVGSARRIIDEAPVAWTVAWCRKLHGKSIPLPTNCQLLARLQLVCDVSDIDGTLAEEMLNWHTNKQQSVRQSVPAHSKISILRCLEPVCKRLRQAISTPVLVTTAHYASQLGVQPTCQRLETGPLGDSEGSSDGLEDPWRIVGDHYGPNDSVTKWPVSVVIHAVQLSYLLHEPNTSNLKSAIVSSVALALPGDEAACIIENVKAGLVRLPCSSVIYLARSKLDLMTMLYERRLFALMKARSTETWSSQIMSDASQQSRYNYLLTV